MYANSDIKCQSRHDGIKQSLEKSTSSLLKLDSTVAESNKTVNAFTEKLVGLDLEYTQAVTKVTGSQAATMGMIHLAQNHLYPWDTQEDSRMSAETEVFDEPRHPLDMLRRSLGKWPEISMRPFSEAKGPLPKRPRNTTRSLNPTVNR